MRRTADFAMESYINFSVEYGTQKKEKDSFPVKATSTRTRNVYEGLHGHRLTRSLTYSVKAIKQTKTRVHTNVYTHPKKMRARARTHTHTHTPHTASEREGEKEIKRDRERDRERETERK